MMRRWRARIIVFAICFAAGLLAAFVYTFIASLFNWTRTHTGQQARPVETRCAAEEFFARPEDVLGALKNEEVQVRREMFRRLFLRPGVTTIYYDYERDRNYPERADRTSLQYINLDETAGPEALLTFVRIEHPVALVFKREKCGWRLAAALGAWLRFEDYPYGDWIETRETVRPGVSEILLRESTGDATYYVRKAHLLKLIDGRLEEIAEFEEESVRPLENYREADWSNVKQRRASRADFFVEHEGQPAGFRLETTDEVVKYAGAQPVLTYWLETDGAWHAARQNWTTRHAERVRLLSTGAQQFVWNEREKRFVKDVNSTS